MHTESLFSKLPGGKTLFISLAVTTVLLAVFFRIWALPSAPPGLYPDEAINATNGIAAVGSGDFKIFYPDNNGREGLFMNLIGLSLSLFGENNIWAVRIPSVIFGILTVLGVYLLAKELFGKEVALFAAFFMAVSFWHVNFSRIAFRGIMVPFLFSYSFYFLISGIKREALWRYILGGLIFGIGFHTYIAYRVTPLILLATLPLLYLIRPNKDNSRPCKMCAGVALFIVCGLITAAPIGLYFLENPSDFLGRTGQVSIFASESPIVSVLSSAVLSLGMFNVRGDFNWRHNIAGSPELFWPISIAFLIGIALTTRRLVRTIRHKDWSVVAPAGFLIVSFFVFLLPALLSTEGLPHALRSIGATVPAYIFAGIGLHYALERFTHFHVVYDMRRIPVLILLLVVLGGTAYMEYDRYFLGWARNPNVEGAFTRYFVHVGDYLNALPQDVKKYVIVNEGGVLVDGIPMPAQTTIFVTRGRSDVTYVTPENLASIELAEKTALVPLRYDNELLLQLESVLQQNLVVASSSNNVLSINNYR